MVVLWNRKFDSRKDSLSLNERRQVCWFTSFLENGRVGRGGLGS